MSQPLELRYLPNAQEDLRRLHAFLAKSDPQSAVKVVDAILEDIALILKNPFMGTPWPDRSDLRRWVVKYGRSGYVIQYGVFDDVLTINRIWHGREDR